LIPLKARREVALDQTTNYPNQRNEGEGNKTAAREYDEAQHRFAQSGKVEEKAREAERAMSGPERAELERAEAIGRRGTMAGTAEMLSRQAREQAARASNYLAHNTQEYPIEAVLVAGLIGYGLGFLIHRCWSIKPWVEEYPDQTTSASFGHSGDALRPLE
jgi:hypothetical protein